jgi:hypothetical protein
MAMVPFRPEHLLALTPPVAARSDLERFARLYRPAGPAWTVLADGAPVGCGGIVKACEVGRGWVILSQPVRTAAIHRAARRAIERELAIGIIRHIEARAIEEWDGACRWLERLGFQAVGRDGEFRVYLR